MNLFNNHIYLIDYVRHYHGLFGNISQFQLLGFHKCFLILQILFLLLEAKLRTLSYGNVYQDIDIDLKISDLKHIIACSSFFVE